MSHLEEERLVFHYYGEDDESSSTDRHLDECADCRQRYAALQRVLNVVDAMPVPERGDDYGERVWRRIEGRIQPGRRFLPLGGPWRIAWASAAMAGLLAAAFLAGRFSHPPQPGRQIAADPHARERVLRAAVGDYLDRSQTVLVEIANARAAAPLDISAEQERARELAVETRLYRQTAALTGASALGTVLEELERVLLDIAHGPSRLSPEEVDGLRSRLRSEEILFKIRVIHSNVSGPEEL
jgi:hypothetical protein